MEEKINMQEVVEEIRSANEDELKATIERWFESTRSDGMKIGAGFISAAVYGVIQRHLKKVSPSLRDYKRMTDEIIKIISVQLKNTETEQNDLIEGNTTNE